MDKKNFIAFADAPVEVVEGRMEPTLAGDPTTKTEKHFVHPSGNMVAGFWECQAGTFDLPDLGRNELCVVVDGEAIIEDETGTAVTVRKGDTFFLPEGSTTKWTVETFIRKVFVVAMGIK